MQEFLERRFRECTRWVLSVVSLVAYIFTKVSFTVYAGALVFRTASAGPHVINVDERPLSSGTYLYRLRAGEHHHTGHMTVIR